MCDVTHLPFFTNCVPPSQALDSVRKVSVSEEDSQAVSGGVVPRELSEEGCLVTFLTKIVPELDVFWMEIQSRVAVSEYVLLPYSVQVV